MICPDCKGLGNLSLRTPGRGKCDAFTLCMRCDGTGALCGVCGGPLDEGGNVCEACINAREPEPCAASQP